MRLLWPASRKAGVNTPVSVSVREVSNETVCTVRPQLVIKKITKTYQTFCTQATASSLDTSSQPSVDAFSTKLAATLHNWLMTETAPCVVLRSGWRSDENKIL